MTKILTIRLAPAELALCDARAKELGVTRTAYVRSCLFDSASPSKVNDRRHFASMDLVGSLAVGRGSTNDKVREALRRKDPQ